MVKHPFGVLIVHGFTSSLDCVNGLQPPIAALGLPMRIPVLRGHGAASPDALRGVAWQDWVTDGEAALQDLLTEAEKVIVVGHSMGVLVTVTLAAEHRADGTVDSVVLAAPPVQLASPLAPGRPLSFLIPVVTRVLDKWAMPPVYADQALAQYDTNYPWAPIGAIQQFLAFSKAARQRLPEINVPALILQSRKDSTVAPESAEITYRELGTAAADKGIVWFEKSEHEMFRDLECEAVTSAVIDYIRMRTGV